MSGFAWSAIEDATLLREWHDVGARTLKSKLPGRTWCAIRNRARDLGLPGGVPQGSESVHAAATRTGYSDPTLARILREHGVKVRQLYPAHSARGQRVCVRQYVAIDEVDTAVAARLATETVNAAARARDLDGGTLHRLLRKCGAIVAGSRKAHRVPTAVIDAALAAHARAA